LLGADGASANATYFNTDQTHPQNAGQTVLAALASNAINAYGVGAATRQAPTYDEILQEQQVRHAWRRRHYV
jgi:hypothetical protein